MKIPGFPGDRDKKSTSTGRKSYFLIPPLALWHPWWHQFMDRMVIFLTVMLCLLMLPTRLPGMELLGIGPNWLLIWVVAWSVNRSVFSGLLSGVILGLLQDAMTSPDPTHALSLGIVGMLTALMQKQRFIQEDFISIALIVFAMAVVADTIFAFQLSWVGNRHAASIWTYYQRATLASAILSSLWAPVVYYPLNRWWQQMKLIRNS
ncbi:MAG: rod shape-determining protein MreD [Nostocales cyanobacterium LE14-WE4]|jgi:rod shape-determining protein MreD|uniref:rod shape-determining protein MreD n=1 Tax=Anabaena sp. AL09 TaxID=1710891 RepID=UPI0007FC1EF1|nr:rod shape-determining protein MreD [Anabaena sp. AL09]MBJ7297125.1 rod shape-determining protein MreD [Dolichospermum sp.]MCE2698461.1 rod shape-determining protein MreD [Anabaena sp. 49633_E8]MDJ0503579.1 rod shape-determining protein MreD [Nostocales cyanobacterium LE14-WE4]OBQ13492.1 MAG: rod shape-determining protein MreD [Anabaena sp. LE011-02]MCE2703444.1 rod shape-determining protein MreD [Anabaena sp. 49633_E8]